MEALRITHLFPRIATLNDRMRRRMMWISLVLLVTLAGVEAALALMRDMLIADKQALIQSLATVQQAQVTDGWVGRIPTAGQMLLGFILPFALAFVAIRWSRSSTRRAPSAACCSRRWYRRSRSCFGCSATPRGACPGC